ncbi:GNAT family N-acetyltransferase [Brachybacterium huguangmaarense]
MADIEVVDNTERHRFEAMIDGELAGFTQYDDRGDAVEFPHTVVADRHEGQGVGSTVVRHALDAMREQGKKVIPTCSFVKGWIDKHPDYQDLVAEQA